MPGKITKLVAAIVSNCELQSEEGDQWMLEVNFTDWEDSGSEREAYWLMAIEAAREYHTKRRDSASASEPL